MPIVEDRVLGGPSQALQNVLVGNLGGAASALTKPEELSPDERDAFLKKHGLDKGPFAAVFRVLTNPAVIITAALSLKFPVPTAQNIFKFSQKVGGYTAKFPITRKLASIHSWFRGTPVKAVSAFLFLVAVLFYGLWLKSIIPALWNNTVPVEVSSYDLPVNPVHVIDVAFALPGLILGSVLLWRGSSTGFVIASVALVFMILLTSDMLLPFHPF